MNFTFIFQEQFFQWRFQTVKLKCVWVRWDETQQKHFPKNKTKEFWTLMFLFIPYFLVAERWLCQKFKLEFKIDENFVFIILCSQVSAFFALKTLSICHSNLHFRNFRKQKPEGYRNRWWYSLGSGRQKVGKSKKDADKTTDFHVNDFKVGGRFWATEWWGESSKVDDWESDTRNCLRRRFPNKWRGKLEDYKQCKNVDDFVR